MADGAKITTHYGDLVEFDCVCGEPLSLVWDCGPETCEKCLRVWDIRSDVVLVQPANADTRDN